MRAADSELTKTVKRMADKIDEAVKTKNWDAFCEAYDNFYILRRQILFEEKYRRDRTQNYSLVHIMQKHIIPVLDNNNLPTDVIARIAQNISSNKHLEESKNGAKLLESIAKLDGKDKIQFLLKIATSNIKTFEKHHEKRILLGGESLAQKLPKASDKNNVLRVSSDLQKAINVLREDQKRLLDEVNIYRPYFKPRYEIPIKDQKRVEMSLSKARAINDLILKLQQASTPSEVQELLKEAMNNKDLTAHRPKGFNVIGGQAYRSPKFFSAFRAKEDVHGHRTKSDTHNHLIDAYEKAKKFNEHLNAKDINYEKTPSIGLGSDFVK